MNFLSHAVIASHRSENPRWILGSMLPDFFTMARVRFESVKNDQMLIEGIKFHHASDDAFHGAPAVIELMQAMTKDLQNNGLDRGPALAIGHVGVELLLDGALIKLQGAIDTYRAAVAELGDIEPFLTFAGQSTEHNTSRWRRLVARLPSAPVPQRYLEPDFVAERLIGILADRPALAVPKGQESIVYSWTQKAAPNINQNANWLLAQVEGRLSATNL